jgi:hypothetical protein
MKYGMDMNGVVRTCSSVHIFIVRYILTDCGWVVLHVLHTVMYRCVHSVDGWNGTHIEKVGVWVHFYCNNYMNACNAISCHAAHARNKNRCMRHDGWDSYEYV